MKTSRSTRLWSIVVLLGIGWPSLGNAGFATPLDKSNLIAGTDDATTSSSVQFKSGAISVPENGGSIRVYVSREAGAIQLAGFGMPPQQSTTGPTPPPGAGPKSPLRADSGGTVRIIAGVPGYYWRHGCGPTALGMVIGYYATHGYPELMSGDASTQTAAVDQAIASQGSGVAGVGYQQHFEDYALPMDGGQPRPAPDRSEHYPVGCHSDNSIADFMQTSWSSVGNHYGWSWSSEIAPAFKLYVSLKSPQSAPQSSGYAMGEGLWSTTMTEIDHNRPMVFLVDSSGDGSTDHFVTVVGYDDGLPRQFACLDTWNPPTQIRWCCFQPMSSAYPWGVWGGWSFQLAGSTIGPASVRVSTTDQTAAEGLDYLSASVTLRWAAGETADKYVDIPILDDRVWEQDETLAISLTDAVGTALGEPSVAAVTIIDDDPRGLIELNPSSLAPACVEGEDAESQTFELWSSGEGPVTFSITADAGWLSCSPGSGEAGAGHNLITVHYETASLSPGTFRATLIIADPGAVNNPQTIVVTLTVTQADRDEDGLPDRFELLYGLNPDDGDDSCLDLDGDGFTNLQEYVCGTDPTDPTDAFGPVLLECVGDDVQLSFRTISGKVYRLEWSEQFMSGPWTPGDELLVGDGTLQQWSDPGAALQPTRLYRVVVVSQP